MKIKKLRIVSFRNIVQADILPHEKFTVFFGKNGQGKTNILEALYLLGTIKSFRHARNRDLIKWGETASSLRGWVESNEVTREVSLIIEADGKKAKVDNKQPARLADFFSTINVVVFSPEEMAIARGEPDGRRRFLDRAIFNGDPGYLSLYHDYYRVLRQRNSLLRRNEKTGFAIWTESLAEKGALLYEHRMAFVEAMRPLLKDYYQHLSSGGEEAGLEYHVHAVTLSGQDVRTAILHALTKHAAEEELKGVTLVGPHRDDLVFTLNGRALRHHASQGQQRSYLLALKMAEIEYLRRQTGSPPILLLDDMTSELDRDRNRNLMDFLRNGEMQTFVTTTDLSMVNLQGIESYAAFRVVEGAVAEGVHNG